MNTSNDHTFFINSHVFKAAKEQLISGPNGWLLFVACNNGIHLAQSVKTEYESMLKKNGNEFEEIPLIGTSNQPLTTVFKDTETCPRLHKHVAGANAFVFQCIHDNTSANSVNENVQQLLQAIRTLRAHRARTITVVIPYNPYSRQDKPSFMAREATLASLFVDQLKTSGADACLTYHPHTLSLYGFYEPEMMLIALSGLDLFVELFSEFKHSTDTVAVSTDAGGTKFTIHFSDAMNIPYAIANKYRPGKEKTSLIGIIGDISDKQVAIILDDETVTGSSLINTVKSLHDTYGIKKIYGAISHNKIQPQYLEKLIEAHQKYGLFELHTTDTIPQIEPVKELSFIKIHSLASRFAATINRLHFNQSVSELFLNIT
ncbi:ribose-phosphate diphosphokinase [Chitinispirillales bacterium ANBcel5]|uniref:ribose-phosphate diphosphokinase n=1 Tax=Cellulosispirillum alkaliphilum TaxID=3039283 RepID=UPI002A4F7484|nr:ribose-phosphate diphosphokinase [Chitinispirillales bacterium ANBcel5]